MMDCSNDRILQSIIRQLSSNSPCGSQLCEVVPAFWCMVQGEGCGNKHLQALLTKREAILFLLGCEAYSVDEAQSHYTMTAQAKADSRSDFQSQAQSTGSSQKVMNAHGETTYNEKSDASNVYSSYRMGRAKDSTDGDSFYRDDGKGFAYNTSQSFSFLENRINHRRRRIDAASSAEVSGRRDCNYEYSQNRTDGSGINLLFVAASFTGTTSEWRKYQSTYAREREDSAGSILGDGTETDTSLSSSHGDHRWEDTFLADIDWYEREHILRFHNERFDSRKVAHAHSDGSGNGMHEQKEEGNSASQGTSLAVGDSETLRTASRVSNLTAFEVMNSQRFRNLERLYDQLTEQINHLRRRLRSTARPLIDTIPCACTSACCCMPQQRRLGYEFLSSCRTAACSSGPGLLWDP